MFENIITGLCLACALTPIAAQLHNDLGFQPNTNNITEAKVTQVGWGTPPPPPPGGWPAIPPPPGWPAPPLPPGGWSGVPPNDCTNPGNPVGSCPADSTVSAYLPSTNCECFFQCANGVPVSQPCPLGLYFNPTEQVCDFPANSGCTPGPTTVGTTAATTARSLRLSGSSTISKKV